MTSLNQLIHSAFEFLREFKKREREERKKRKKNQKNFRGLFLPKDCIPRSQSRDCHRLRWNQSIPSRSRDSSSFAWIARYTSGISGYIRLWTWSWNVLARPWRGIYRISYDIVWVWDLILGQEVLAVLVSKKEPFFLIKNVENLVKKLELLRKKWKGGMGKHINETWQPIAFFLWKH